MKVLLFANDTMPFGSLPTSGGGLRCWQIKKGLESQGIEVVSSMPAFTYLTEKHFDEIPDEQKEQLWYWHTQREVLERVKPDAVIFSSNWDHYALGENLDVPLIIDLHGSRMIETAMWGQPASADRKLDILSKADCLLTAGTWQQLYFYGWLVQAGRVPSDEHFIRYIPISLPPEQREHVYPNGGSPVAPHFVSGGGWFPWQNQSKAVFSICNKIMKHDRGTIDIYGTPHEATSEPSAEELVIRDIYKRIKGFSEESPRIKVNGYVGRDALLDVYHNASVAVEAMTYNIERELAFTTRTIEYLWCGLPVLYNNYNEVSTHIQEYDAGWAVDPDSELEIERALEEIFESPELVRKKGENASRLARERFSWDKTIAPLVDYLENPIKAPKAKPVYGVVCSRPSFLVPRGKILELEFLPSDGYLVQRVIVPAENVSEIELPVMVNDESALADVKHLECLVLKKNGRTVVHKKFSVSELMAEKALAVPFPTFRAPAGGEELTVKLRLAGKRRATLSPNAITIQCLPEVNYPFIEGGNLSALGALPLGEEQEIKALALSFVPGGSRVFRAKQLTRRALEMVKRGEWKRIYYASARRLPALANRIRSFSSS